MDPDCPRPTILAYFPKKELQACMFINGWLDSFKNGQIIEIYYSFILLI